MGSGWWTIKKYLMNLKKFNLVNRIAVITGAGGLLGFEHAYALLECDATVILTDKSQKKLLTNYNKLIKKFNKKRIFFKTMDVTSEKSILSCLNFFKKKKLLVEILINNASFNPKQTTLNVNNKLEKFSINKWNEEIDVGLKGAFLCSRIFGNEMVKNKKGVIINIASDLSVISPDNRLYNKGKKINIVKPVSYSVVKSGLIGLTKYISTYWALKNVRCNAISPGGVFDNQNKNFLKKIKKVIPLGRMAEKNEYRSAIQFLCSDASSYMNGHNMVIDGGRSVW